jgi:hypothetical protein
MDFHDDARPKPTDAPASTTPHLVEPPKPAQPTIAPTTDADPDNHGDEPASGTSAA